MCHFLHISFVKLLSRRNILNMRDTRQKEKKKLPQNKPSRDEFSLPWCNISSMAGSADHGCFDDCHGLRTKNNKKNTYNITTAKKYALHCWWTVLKPPCSLDRLIQPWTRSFIGAGRARHGSVCFEATSFFLFGGSPSFGVTNVDVKGGKEMTLAARTTHYLFSKKHFTKHFSQRTGVPSRWRGSLAHCWSAKDWTLGCSSHRVRDSKRCN